MPQMIHMYIYNTSWLEINNQNYIWKSSVFIHALQSGWGFRNLTKVILELFQRTFSYWVRSVTNMPAYSRNRTWFTLNDIWKDMFGKVWFLKRYHSNHQCTVTKSKFICDCISDLIKICIRDIFYFWMRKYIPY